MVEPLFKKKFSVAPSEGSCVELDAEEAKHAISVRRMRVDEAIQLTDGRGLRVKGFVSEVRPKSLMVKVATVTQEQSPVTEITLVQALAKGDRDELAIQAATELGIMRVIPWQAERSISRWDAAKAARGQVRWQVICDEAAKQSLRVWHPRVEPLADSGALTKSFAEFDQVFVLDPTASQGLASQKAFSSKIAVVVGPEGGIDESELSLFEAAGAIRVGLGDSILRTSTAGVAAISVIQAAMGRFD
jgi:16S rRNA (uracil1498-N3)-methyltransferase